MVEAQTIFNLAMGIMDELSPTGEAMSSNTKDYEYRTPAILNALTAEIKMLLGDNEGWTPTESLSDYVSVDNNFAYAAMGYGLAANLLVDENPTAAAFYQQRYEEMRAQYLRSVSSEIEGIENMYGGIEYGRFSRW